MDVDPLPNHKRAEIVLIAKVNGATRVRIFGSFERGMARTDSNLDLLLDLEPGRHLLDLVAIKQDLEDLLGRPVHQERFLTETHWQDAVNRQLEVIGEATKRLSPELRSRHPEVAWRRVRQATIQECLRTLWS